MMYTPYVQILFFLQRSSVGSRHFPEVSVRYPCT